MNKGVKFLILLIPGYIVAYIIFTIFFHIAASVVGITPFLRVWSDFMEIENSGMIYSWFAVIPWAFGYFSRYPLEVLVGLVGMWREPIMIFFGIFLSAGWSGLIKDAPKAE